MPEKKEIPVRDFFEEHRKLKESGSTSSQPKTPQPAQPFTQFPTSQAPSTPAVTTTPATISTPASPVAQRAHQSAPSQPAQSAEHEPMPFIQLKESLKGLGYDVRPLESLQNFAEMLDVEEQKLMKDIQEKQRRLETVRTARRLLKALGI